MHQILNYIFCCDWGTSSLRLRLIEVETQQVICKIQTEEGIGRLFVEWSEDGAQSESRHAYLLRILAKQMDAIQQQVDFSVVHIPMVISGMASSSIGLLEIPYAQLPFSTEGKDISARYIAATPAFAHDIYLISGVKSDDDVIRGEEIEVIGLSFLKELNASQFTGDCILVLPGTHSKHLLIKGKQVVSFKTFMTGEFFQLLSEKSILKDSVVAVNGAGLTQTANRKAFCHGVQTAVSNDLLHASFLARTNHLFGKYTKTENAFFLSGLLIGYELRDLKKEPKVAQLVISCGENLFRQYSCACEELGYSNVAYISSDSLEQATVAGQIEVFKRFHNENSTNG